MGLDSELRAQASLPALAIALLILTSVTVLSLAVADGALASADRSPDERHVATSVADRIVATDGPVSTRRNVVGTDRLEQLNASTVTDHFPVTEGTAVRISIDDERVVDDPGAAGGTTVRRIVAVRNTETRSITPAFGPNKAVTLPRRTNTLGIDLDSPNGTTIRTVRADGRILLRNPSGLDGQHQVDLSRFETARIQFVGPGPLQEGNVTLEYPVEEIHRATLAVTVDG